MLIPVWQALRAKATARWALPATGDSRKVVASDSVKIVSTIFRTFCIANPAEKTLPGFPLDKRMLY
jgi:hypothetical protein